VEAYRIATDELPQINGAFGCAVPDGHAGYASGVFSGTTISQKGTIISGNKGEYIIYGYKLNFGKNNPHNNTQSSIAAYCWKRTA